VYDKPLLKGTYSQVTFHLGNIFAVLKQQRLEPRETKASFVFIIWNIW